MSDELASTLASIQEFMARSGFFYLGTTYGVPFHLSYHYETVPPPAATMSPPIVTTTDDTRLAEQEAKDVAHEFLTQFAFSVDIDVSRRELEAIRQRPDESISSFVSRWRAKVAGMIDRPKEQDQIDMVLRNLQSRFARCLVGILFQDLRSLVQAAFSVEKAIARELWTDIVPSPDSKGRE
ncbi:hypothetical protein CK203_017674 [Vitis vinifera]|uniref:Retrotransposon gag domain-containing protein n=1 Tax=Vitis vinifera TaxID=29760 RepID=A0A438JH80_VITVI|nr:hypothetical protein CK203_017674 [Vitis vinifera]